MAALPPNSKPVEGSDDRFPAPAFARAVLAPAFGLSQAHHLGHLMTMHRAHGVMLHEQGLLSAEDIASLLRALAAIEADLASRKEPVAYTGEHEDLFFYIERELARHVGVDTAARLHTGRSRNDIDHTLFKMALKERPEPLVAPFTGPIEKLIERAGPDARPGILALTNGQPRQPPTIG
ncbi:MAG: argininosuccinate lyase, partial [Alphaproteobacteria bacterium]|nr:argininosuccinate lyase [Alphaproteobacteria bacterium]